MHLVVTSEDGAVFRRLHPLRTAPGVLAVRLNVRDRAATSPTPRSNGRERADNSSTEPSKSPATPGPATHIRRPVPRLTPSAPVAGRPVTVEVRTERPIRPWLGMPGHLIVGSQDGDHLAHAHGTAAGKLALRFTLTLPDPGRYLAWVQYAEPDRLVTRPFTMEVDR